MEENGCVENTEHGFVPSCHFSDLSSHHWPPAHLWQEQSPHQMHLTASVTKALGQVAAVVVSTACLGTWRQEKQCLTNDWNLKSYLKARFFCNNKKKEFKLTHKREEKKSMKCQSCWNSSSLYIMKSDNISLLPIVGVIQLSIRHSNKFLSNSQFYINNARLDYKNLSNREKHRGFMRCFISKACKLRNTYIRSTLKRNYASKWPTFGKMSLKTDKLWVVS